MIDYWVEVRWACGPSQWRVAGESCLSSIASPSTDPASRIVQTQVNLPSQTYWSYRNNRAFLWSRHAKAPNKANWGRQAGPVTRDRWPGVRGTKNAKQSQFPCFWAKNEGMAKRQSQLGPGWSANVGRTSPLAPNMRNKANWPGQAGPVTRDRWPVARGTRNAKQSQFVCFWTENRDSYDGRCQPSVMAGLNREREGGKPSRAVLGDRIRRGEPTADSDRYFGRCETDSRCYETKLWRGWGWLADVYGKTSRQERSQSQVLRR